ncbi:MAG: hypothetical protein J5606_04420 [Bacteroidales bacterium]|nr:hypothetical protein [Bacteroidales bacterium]
MKKIVGIFIAIFLINSISKAQVSARLDSNAMLIGDQMNLTFAVETDQNAKVLFPSLCDTCIDGLEIIDRQIDTTHNNGRIAWKQTLHITSFNEGEHIIAPFALYDQDSNLLGNTNTLSLTINTLPVDTAAAIKDIKAPLAEPITLKEILTIVMWILIGLMIIALLVFAIYKLSKRKKTPKQTTAKPKPTEPAHIIALRDLEQLQQKRLWQNGHVKEYYTQLSEICRTYMYNRWDISAMEMVNDEIEASLKNIHIDNNIIKKIINNLQSCDLAKFAKYTPLPDENAAIYKDMVNFIETTKEIASATNNK